MDQKTRDEVKMIQAAHCADVCNEKFVRQKIFDKEVRTINSFVKTKASINLLTPITQQLRWNNKLLVALLISLVLGAVSGWYKYSKLQTDLERQISAVKTQTLQYQSGAKVSLEMMKKEQEKTAASVQEIVTLLLQYNGGD